MTFFKIIQKILIYTIVSIGTIIILGIIAGSGYLYFENDKVIKFTNSLNESFHTLLNNIENNINQTIVQITKLVGSNGSEGEIQQNINSIINELQTLQQANPQINFQDQITKLQGFKDNIINNNLSNLVQDVQSATNSALSQIKSIDNTYINPFIKWLNDNSKKIALITFIVSSSILGFSILFTIIVKSKKHNKKDKKTS